MVTLAQLACFIAVAEELHFGRAAERLRMTQPPLSRQIQLLERHLGAPLLDRSSRSVRLTPAGRAFLDDARRILRDTERATLAVRQIGAGTSGTLRIGFTAGSAHSGLQDVLQLARAELPSVAVDLRELVTQKQHEALSEGAIDLGIARPASRPPHLSFRALYEEPFVAAVPVGHPLSSGDEPLPLTALHQINAVMYSPIDSRYFHDLLTRAFSDLGVIPQAVQHLSQIHSMLALVQAGWGLALVPRSATRMRFEGVRYRPLRADVPLKASLELVWRSANDSPALLRLLELLPAPDDDARP
ncbi:LysR family transcriptional regulator [Micromonospora sp. NPDC048830]|uniref:LysR family transcriptional regulator n=1 Tax=Micromonospora sp. NPDC048830 TaxID=3364257 RepID=UPI003723528D